MVALTAYSSVLPQTVRKIIGDSNGSCAGKKMTKIEISKDKLTESEYYSESEESVEIRADKPNTVDLAWPKIRSKRVMQLLGSGIVLGLIFWAAYIVVSGKKIGSIDVIIFELTIATIICFAIAMHLRRTSTL